MIKSDRPQQIAVATEHMDDAKEIFEVLDWGEKLSELESILNSENMIALLLIDATQLGKVEAQYGKTVYQQVMEKFRDILFNLQGNQIRKNDILASNYKNGSHYYIFLTQKRESTVFMIQNYENIAERLCEHINQSLQKTLSPLLREKMRINVGFSIAIRNPLIGTERLITRMIDDAKLVARYQAFRISNQNKEKLQELIIREDLRVLFQPLVDIRTMTVMGYEALARGPLGTRFESPLTLFGEAEETGLMFELDRLCRKRALYYARELPESQQLFINILPVTIRDPDFKIKKMENFVQSIGLTPSNIVFEVSEQQAIENFHVFKEEAKWYSEMGFSIAIDDAGTGYSNFQSMVELKPKYIKLDISLIKELHLNPVKQEIVRSMVGIGNSIQAQIIAEGVETVEELFVLGNLGVVFVQGFLFARPAYPFPEINIPNVGRS